MARFIVPLILQSLLATSYAPSPESVTSQYAFGSGALWEINKIDPPLPRSTAKNYEYPLLWRQPPHPARLHPVRIGRPDLPGSGWSFSRKGIIPFLLFICGIEHMFIDKG
jgi:hypothetical protein